MRISARTITAFASVVVLGLTACGGDDSSEKAVERAIERAGGGDVDVDVDEGSGDVRISSGDDSFDLSTTGDLPDDWPSDIPLPDDFAVSGGSSINGGSSGQLVSVTGTTELSLDEVAAFYTDALSGWTEALRSEVTHDGVRSLNLAFQLDDRFFSVGGQEQDGRTELGFSYTYALGEGEEPTTSIGLDGNVDVDIDDLGIEGASEALEALGPERIAEALVSTLDAERYEILDGTVHIHLGDDASYSAMVACLVGSAVIADTPVVVHGADGTENAC